MLLQDPLPYIISWQVKNSDPSSQKNNPTPREILLAACLAYSSEMKMEIVC
jgi:hypothetical protein